MHAAYTLPALPTLPTLTYDYRLMLVRYEPAQQFVDPTRVQIFNPRLDGNLEQSWRMKYVMAHGTCTYRGYLALSLNSIQMLPICLLVLVYHDDGAKMAAKDRKMDS
jgi:hypothetical protein